MLIWLINISQKLFGPPPAQVTADDDGIEVRAKGKVERVIWGEIEEVVGVHHFRRDFFSVLAGKRQVDFGWPDNGVHDAIRMMEVKLPGFPGTWSAMMHSEAPFEALLWRKQNAGASPED